MQFKEIDDAKKAMEEMNGKEFHGRTLTVELAKRSKPYNPTPGVCMFSNYLLFIQIYHFFKHIIIIFNLSFSYIDTYTFIYTYFQKYSVIFTKFSFNFFYFYYNLYSNLYMPNKQTLDQIK